MDWRGRRQSSNVEDRRGQPVRAGGVPGLMLVVRLLPWLLRSRAGRVLLGLGVAAFVGARMLGIDILQVSPGSGNASATAPFAPQEQELAEFVAVVLADTEATWQSIFTAMGGVYEEPVLVLFSQRVASACGSASSAMGPFYCPADRKVYLDLSFFRDLDRQLGAPGDFAQAYVIAHEVAHHVGITCKRCWGSASRSVPVARARRARQSTRCLFARNCRPIALRAFGVTQHSSSARCWSQEILRKRCAPLPRLAMTACSNAAVATSCPTASLTAHRRSAWNGSAAVSLAVT